MESFHSIQIRRTNREVKRFTNAETECWRVMEEWSGGIVEVAGSGMGADVLVGMPPPQHGNSKRADSLVRALLCPNFPERADKVLHALVVRISLAM